MQRLTETGKIQVPYCTFWMPVSKEIKTW